MIQPLINAGTAGTRKDFALHQIEIEICTSLNDPKPGCEPWFRNGIRSALAKSIKRCNYLVALISTLLCSEHKVSEMIGQLLLAEIVAPTIEMLADPRIARY